MSGDKQATQIVARISYDSEKYESCQVDHIKNDKPHGP